MFASGNSSDFTHCHQVIDAGGLCMSFNIFSIIVVLVIVVPYNDDMEVLNIKQAGYL
jgi:hypothetical protein